MPASHEARCRELEVRTDSDALDEAIAACGFRVLVWKQDDPQMQGPWNADIRQDEPPHQRVAMGYSTPREAKSAALWQAVFA